MRARLWGPQLRHLVSAGPTLAPGM
jgi:hypothetical protein